MDIKGMRILITCVSRYPRIGGVSTYIRELKDLLGGVGCHAEVLARHPRTRRFYFVSESRDVPVAPDLPHPDAGLALGHFLCESDRSYDLIHAMEPYSAIGATQTKVPVVMTLHSRLGATLESLASEGAGKGGRPRKGRRKKRRRFRNDAWRRRAFERLALSIVDQTVVASEWLRSQLAPMYEPDRKDRLHVVANGLDETRLKIETSDPARIRRRWTRRGEWVVVCSGRLVESKGQGDLIRAVRILRRRGVPIRLWLVGSGSGRARLKRLAARLRVRRHVTLVGGRDDVFPWIRAADVVAVPSHVDNQPYSVIEAQMAGKPLVAAGVGGIPEMVRDGVTGLLVPPKRPRALADALNTLYSEPQLAQGLGDAAGRWGQAAWSGERFIREILDVYLKTGV